MKKILVLILSVLFACNIANAEQGQFRIGAELGWSPVELEAENTAQQLANLSGSTVNVEYDTGAFVGRIFGDYGVTSNVDIEVGYFQTSSVDATYKIGSDSATESYDANGLDIAAVIKGDSGFFGKAGMHSSTINAFGSIKIGATTYSVTDSIDGTGMLAGLGYEQDQIRYSFTHYADVGGDGGSDFNFFSVGYIF